MQWNYKLVLNFDPDERIRYSASKEIFSTVSQALKKRLQLVLESSRRLEEVSFVKVVDRTAVLRNEELDGRHS